jgi:hypothetical protein
LVSLELRVPPTAHCRTLSALAPLVESRVPPKFRYYQTLSTLAPLVESRVPPTVHYGHCQIWPLWLRVGHLQRLTTRHCQLWSIVGHLLVQSFTFKPHCHIRTRLLHLRRNPGLFPPFPVMTVRAQFRDKLEMNFLVLVTKFEIDKCAPATSNSAPTQYKAAGPSANKRTRGGCARKEASLVHCVVQHRHGDSDTYYSTALPF